MTTKKASPLTGAIILGGFIVLAAVVLFAVRGRLQGQGHGSHHEPAWKTHHVEEKQIVAAKESYTVLTAFESTPRPVAKVRTLQEFYSRRAYAGAPPVIPHEVQFDGRMNDDCLSCHQDGGFVPEQNAYSPVTPHPEMANCRQCHVEQVTEGEFVKTEWTQPDLPKRGRQAIPGGPPLIPHSLQLRENCLACHAGPQAVVEIRTSHPERENCLQCHVLDQDVPPFKSLLENRVELAHAQP